MAIPTTSGDRALSQGVIRGIERVVGKGNVLTGGGELLAFESDALTAYRATPAAVVFVHDAAELQQVVALLYGNGVSYVPRGAGTGLSGGALADGSVIIELSRMNRILWIDAENRRARLQPGVVNAALQEAVASHGLMYAPDPSSQTVSTLGGNVAENSGGPHCLKYGVTTNHILGLQVVLPDGGLVELGPNGAGYDLVGVFVGSEGTLGICSEIEVRLVPSPAATETLLAHFDAIGAASAAVSAIIAAGIVPAALEMIDRETLKAVEASIYAAGFPTDVAASLIVELDGPRAGLNEGAAEVEALLREHGAREVARAADEAERTRFWKARKSAFGAMGRLAPELLVQDGTVPRSRLPEVLDRVYEITGARGLVVSNVFHAGDGNLHPNIPFDRRDPGVLERVQAASREIVEACVAAGGTITGEHGVGLDKRKYMPLIHSEADLEAMRWVKATFDPAGLCNPGKLLPDAPEVAGAGPPVGGARTKDVPSTIEVELGPHLLLDDMDELIVDGEFFDYAVAPATTDELVELLKLAARSDWRILPFGYGGWLDAGHPGRRPDLVLTTRRLTSTLEHHPDDLLATVSAGVTLRDLNNRLRGASQWWPLDPPGRGTLGAALASGAAGPLAAAYGTPRDLTLGLTVGLADGRLIKAGGRVVKNVAGYDMVKLFTGSWGTLGVIVEAHLRLHALPKRDETRIFSAARPAELIQLATRWAAAEELDPAATELLSPAAAAILGLDGEAWALVGRWLGHRVAVGAATQAAEGAARDSRLAVQTHPGIWSELGDVQDRAHAGLSLRVDLPMGSLMGFLGRATTFAAPREPLVVASPTLGRAWIHVEWVAGDSRPDSRTWALRIDELRRAAGASGGRVRVERASLELRKAVDPWGDTGASLKLHGGLKKRFDPDSRLKAGFFAGNL